MNAGAPGALLLASQSQARFAMLRAAGVSVTVQPAHIDEEALTAAMVAAGQEPRAIADALAEAKAVKLSGRFAGQLVLGADQLLVAADGTLVTKAATPEAARATLRALSGTRHRLISAAVAAQDGAAIWRHIGIASLWVRPLSDAFIDSYIDAHWDDIRSCVGCYQVEGAGAALFERVEGDIWTIMGLPLLPLMAWLRARGVVAS